MFLCCDFRELRLKIHNVREDALVFGPLRGGGGKSPEPLRKEKTLFFYQLKKLPKPHEPLSFRGGRWVP